MSLYDDTDPNALRYLAHHRRVQDRVTARFNAEHKARDPLSYYWKMGVHNLRDTFGKLLDFRPEPEDFYHEGKYDDVCEQRQASDLRTPRYEGTDAYRGRGR